jgi:hypothetical protein
VAWPLTLPVALPFRPGLTRFGRPAPRALSTDDAPTSPLSRPEVPSAYESPPPCSQLSLKASGGAAAGTSALPPRPSVRHAFTRRLYALDPITLPAIHRSSWATCRSSTSAIERIHEHNLETSRPRCSFAMASHRASGGAALARRRQLSCHGSGVTPSALTLGQPPQRPPSPSWIYPKPIDSDTSCCSLTPSVARIGPRTATVRTSAPPDPLQDRWEDQLAGAHRTPLRERDSPCRAVSRRHSRKQLRSTAPEVPSTPRTPLLAGCCVSTAANLDCPRGLPHDQPRSRAPPRLGQPSPARRPRHLCYRRKHGLDRIHVPSAQPHGLMRSFADSPSRSRLQCPLRLLRLEASEA